MKYKAEIIRLLETLAHFECELQYTNAIDYDAPETSHGWMAPEEIIHNIEYKGGTIERTFNGNVVFHIKKLRQPQSFINEGQIPEVLKVSKNEVSSWIASSGIPSEAYTLSEYGSGHVVRIISSPATTDNYPDKIKQILPAIARSMPNDRIAFRFKSNDEAQDHSAIDLLQWSALDRVPTVFRVEIQSLAQRGGRLEILIGDYTTIVWPGVNTESTGAKAKSLLPILNDDLRRFKCNMTHIEAAGGSANFYSFTGPIKLLR